MPPVRRPASALPNRDAVYVLRPLDVIWIVALPERLPVVSLPAKLVAKFLRPFIDKARNFALFDPVFWTGWRG